MEFKRCARCGCFFESSNSVCCNCEAKDKQDIYTLNNYLLDFPSVSCRFVKHMSHYIRAILL